MTASVYLELMTLRGAADDDSPVFRSRKAAAPLRELRSGASCGHGTEEIATRLMEESEKARENGENYARLTAENAAAAVTRAGGRSRA